MPPPPLRVLAPVPDDTAAYAVFPAQAQDDAPTAVAAPLTDPALGRLARGVQDCARALACLADRLDVLEGRLDDDPSPLPTYADVGSSRLAPADAESLHAMVVALEGMSADRLQGVDQRLRRLETLPQAIGRLQVDTARLSELATGRGAEPAERPRAPLTGPDLAPVYQELDSVAEVVAEYHAAATQSLERVRTLERAVLEMRRHLEWNLAEQARVAAAERADAGARIERLDARLATLEGATPRRD